MPKNSSNRIAFVIDLHGVIEEQVSYVLTSSTASRNEWSVWKPCRDKDKRKQRSTREYAQALFMLFSHAVYRSSPIAEHQSSRRQVKVKDTPVVIAETDRLYGYWVRKLHTTIEKGPKDYQEIPAQVRKGLRPLLAAKGRREKGGMRRIEIANDCTERVFFLNANSAGVTSIDLEEYANTESRLQLYPESLQCLDSGDAYTIAQRMRKVLSPKTWQDFYRCYAIEHKYAPSPRWLTPMCSKVENPDKVILRLSENSCELTGLPSTLYEAVMQYKKVILAGASGTGKTTALRLLENSLLIQELEGVGACLPIYIRLKECEKFFCQSIDEYGTINIPSMMGQAIAMRLYRNCAERIFTNSEVLVSLVRKRRPDVNPETLSKDEFISCISGEVATWFDNQGSADSTVVLLLDGINELRPQIRDVLTELMSGLWRKQCRVVVSCRTNAVYGLVTGDCANTAFCVLHEVSEDGIIDYFHNIGVQEPERAYYSQVEIDPRVAAMTKNAFFLSIIGQMLAKNPDGVLPHMRAELVKDMIFGCIERKQQEKVTTDRNTPDDVMFVVLQKVARWCMRSMTLESRAMRSSFLLSPEFREIEYFCRDAFRALEAAEAYGLLGFSGLLRESHERFGYPVFIHDNIRDYFAAQYLLQVGGLPKVPTFHDIIEYDEWEGPLQIYFELIQDEARLTKDLDVVVAIDWFLAARCLRWSHIGSERHAKTLLKRFAKGRMQKVFTYFMEGNKYSVQSGLGNILGTYDSQNLIDLYTKPTTKTHFKCSVPRTLVAKLGRKAFPLLRQLADIPQDNRPSEVLSAISDLGTYESWEYLADRFIRTAQANDPYQHVFPLLLMKKAFRPKPEAIFSMIEKVKTALSIPDGQEGVYMVMRTVASPIGNMGRRYEHELLEMLEATNVVIREEAFKALRRQQHPVAMGIVHNRLKENSPIWTFSCDFDEDIAALVRLHDRDTDNRLWEFCKDEMGKGYMGQRVYPALLNLAAILDRNRLREVVNWIIETDGSYIPGAMRAVAAADAQRVLDIVQKGKYSPEMLAREFRRTILLRALCGDVTVKDDLLKILADLCSITWFDMSVELDKYQSGLREVGSKLLQKGFQEIVFETVRSHKIVEAIPILEDIINESKDTLLHFRAIQIWFYLRYLRIKTKKEVQEFVDIVGKSCVKTGELGFWLIDFLDLSKEWSDETLAMVLKELRDVTERILTSRSKKDATVPYALISILRKSSGRKHLKIFAGWPASPLGRK